MYRSSESYALNKLRRSLVFVAIGYGYFLVAFGISRRPDSVPQFTEFLALVSAAISAVGFYFSRKKYGLWIMIISFALYVLFVVFDPEVREPWMQLSVLCAIVAISIAFMSEKEVFWRNVAFITIVAIFNFWAYFTSAPSLLGSGSFLGRGSVSSFMVFSTGLFIVHGWRKMLISAENSDHQKHLMMDKLAKLKETQESQKSWRELVVRIHETTLNTLRSIITMREVPIDNFKSEIVSAVEKNRSLLMSAQNSRTGSVISAIRAGIDAANIKEKVKIISKGVNLHLEHEIFDVTERIIRESLRNAITHGRAKHVEISWRTVSEPLLVSGARERGTLYLEISDDGQDPPQSAQIGIGTHLVMANSVEQLGGKFELFDDDEQGRIVRVMLPSSPPPRSAETEESIKPTNAIELGKYMALLTLFGPAMTGILFFPLLGIWWPGQYFSQILGFIAQITLFYMTFLKRKKMGWLASSALAALLLLSLHFINIGPLTCISAQPIQWLFNITVYGLFIIMLWGKWQITAISYPIFLFLAKDFSPLTPNSCNFIFAFPLINTLMSFLFVWMVFYVVYKSLDAVEKLQQKRFGETTQLIENLESRDRAYQRVLDLDNQTQDALIKISEKSGVLGGEDLILLRKLDSELRAELQLEPGLSGGLTILACEFTRRVVAENRWLEVKSIHGDDDSRPLPNLLRERFLDFASEVPNGSTIHVFAHPELVQLSITCKGEPPQSLQLLQKSIAALNESGLMVECTYHAGENQYVLTIAQERVVAS
jgi:hypothetical protein